MTETQYDKGSKESSGNVEYPSDDQIYVPGVRVSFTLDGYHEEIGTVVGVTATPSQCEGSDISVALRGGRILRLNDGVLKRLLVRVIG